LKAKMKGVIAVLLASGLGTRLGSLIPKQFTMLEGKTIFEHAVGVFEHSDAVDHIIVVVHPNFRGMAQDICHKAGFRKIKQIVDGGSTRFESSQMGVAEITDLDARVLIHDVARPCVSERVIQKCVEALQVHDALSVAVPSSDTVFIASDNYVVQDIPPRSSMYLVQTPQGFRANIIKRAHEQAQRDGAEPTDDCSLVVKYQLADVHLVLGDYTNIKVTHPVDLVIASAILQGGES
jgi:2-C-methyl-D-erythritol 4-phosphate cytidylyltransferase